ncbi:hypothetical protein HFP51_02890 [Parasphingopyxis sp. CP4]|uniref:hypothetical protein n=1 Tax=Parasphingopyxis sp. CP4 TaxID=2724527 RepID=UPI0015A075FE|nr:hypothetical protein [Parasphingopyxis sp. CP4]QLC21224.1 hypothetical protein HFP51_02890 [Parasphingopyxis sp. CP4]
MKRFKFMIFLVALGTSVSTSTGALACRMQVPNGERLVEYPVIVLASITFAEGVDTPGWNTWQLTAQLSQSNAGLSGDFVYHFNVTLSSTGCGQAELPVRGDRWVLYLDDANSSNVQRAYPLNYVRSHDARLADFDW